MTTYVTAVLKTSFIYWKLRLHLVFPHFVYIPEYDGLYVHVSVFIMGHLILSCQIHSRLCAKSSLTTLFESFMPFLNIIHIPPTK